MERKTGEWIQQVDELPVDTDHAGDWHNSNWSTESQQWWVVKFYNKLNYSHNDNFWKDYILLSQFEPITHLFLLLIKGSHE